MSFYLNWDAEGERLYENGVRRGVLYPQDPTTGAYEDGVVWNGLTSIQVTPSGGEANAQYADDIKYLNLYSLEEVGATIEAFTYPDEFEPCDGSKPVAANSKLYARTQTRKPFGLCWRTNVGTDLDDEAAYIIHIMYGCKASPSERQYQTINDSPEPITFSWEVSTTPPVIGLEGFRDTSLFEINTKDLTTDAERTMLTNLENKLYGTAATGGTEAVMPTLPTVAQLIADMTPQG